MPLFEIAETGELVPFRRLSGGAELYEREIEDLVWKNPDEILNEPLLLVARQPNIAAGGRPDVVALSRDARVVVVEVKRDVDRGQLAQCLEYAGWARTTSLDELAGMYHRGHEAFFNDWQEFTEDNAPAVIVRRPRLILIARGFHGRTESALDFLVENGLPVQVLEISIYEDVQGRRFVNVEGEHEPELPISSQPPPDAAPETTIEGRRITLSDLMEAGLLGAGDALVWERPRLGQIYHATVTEDAAIGLEDGHSFSTPSKAAKHAANIPAYDGWHAWKVERRGVPLNELRKELIALRRNDPSG